MGWQMTTPFQESHALSSLEYEVEVYVVEVRLSTLDSTVGMTILGILSTPSISSDLPHPFAMFSILTSLKLRLPELIGSSCSWMTPSMSILSNMAWALVGLMACTSTFSPVLDSVRIAGPLLTSFCREDLAAAHSVMVAARQLEIVVGSVETVSTTDQVLWVRVRVMKRALPSLLSPNPDSTKSITSFTTGSFRFMPMVAATRDSRPKSFMVGAKKDGGLDAARDPCQLPM